MLARRAPDRPAQGALLALRAARETIVWALGVILLGTVVTPLLHAHGHRLDHVHAPGHTHEGHGDGSLAHFGLAMLGVETDALEPPRGTIVACVPAAPDELTVERYLLAPHRAQGP